MNPFFMTWGFIALFCAAGGAAASSEPQFATGQHRYHLDVSSPKKIQGGYLLFLPKEYGKDRKLWPTILFLHGAGERGDDLGILGRIALPMVLEERDDFPFIVISPQCPKGRTWSNEFLVALLDEIVSKYRVDTDRIYLTGLSMGGNGTWNLAMECPGRFAAIAPVCGWGDTSRVSVLRDVPVWVFHGELDTSVPVARGREIAEALVKAGGNVKTTLYPGRGHDCWHETYNDPVLYEWLLRHKKSDQGK